MNSLPLQIRDGHVFVEIGDERWLIDTGAPTSFGASRSLSVAGERFSLGTSYLGLTSETLSQFVGVPCVGLLGADVLSRFDHLFDAASGRVTISTSELSHGGQSVCLDDFMGIPIVKARVGSNDYRMFFDTGAQISYFQDESLIQFPPSGTVTDFYPGVGQFETKTYEVPMLVGDVAIILRCGTLPPLLGMTLMMASTKGIVGNSLLSNRIVGYFPRRRTLVL